MIFWSWKLIHVCWVIRFDWIESFFGFLLKNVPTANRKWVFNTQPRWDSCFGEVFSSFSSWDAQTENATSGRDRSKKPMLNRCVHQDCHICSIFCCFFFSESLTWLLWVSKNLPILACCFWCMYILRMNTFLFANGKYSNFKNPRGPITFWEWFHGT